MTIREELEAAKSAELLTVRQLAILAQYNEQTIYRKLKKGQIPGIVRWGRAIRFNRTVALAWTREALLARDLRPAH